MGKKINVFSTSESQWLKFPNGCEGGIEIKKGNNSVDEEIWEIVKKGRWAEHLLEKGIIEIKEKKDKKGKENKIATEDINELQDMMNIAESETIKTKIARKIKKVQERE
jgi:hypothetical protein